MDYQIILIITVLGAIIATVLNNDKRRAVQEIKDAHRKEKEDAALAHLSREERAKRDLELKGNMHDWLVLGVIDAQQHSDKVIEINKKYGLKATFTGY
ncbi:hypothetical protein [Marivivens donghaensis]|uniref:hypothetical protein n=1 Tax=Marivivens donghaensis TaxID=1699413 RepID=UPI00201E93F0|nr:hypothetical protein [Marivivens donghaensis]MCL7409995.1 hypothetical protein [Marivivens donghaensis]MDN3705404.1 hypothetical protein [Marivivens donghaensis]